MTPEAVVNHPKILLWQAFLGALDYKLPANQLQMTLKRLQLFGDYLFIRHPRSESFVDVRSHRGDARWSYRTNWHTQKKFEDAEKYVVAKFWWRNQHF